MPKKKTSKTTPNDFKEDIRNGLNYFIYGMIFGALVMLILIRIINLLS